MQVFLKIMCLIVKRKETSAIAKHFSIYQWSQWEVLLLKCDSKTNMFVFLSSNQVGGFQECRIQNYFFESKNLKSKMKCIYVHKYYLRNFKSKSVINLPILKIVHNIMTKTLSKAKFEFSRNFIHLGSKSFFVIFQKLSFLKLSIKDSTKFKQLALYF